MRSQIEKETKDVDVRCDDEIDELKKIFYMFFIITSNLTTSDQGFDHIQDKKVNIARNKTNSKQYKKDIDKIEFQLRELYQDKKRRKEMQLNDRHENGGFEHGYGSSINEQDDAELSENERYKRYKQIFLQKNQDLDLEYEVHKEPDKVIYD